jgi:hypothetical protein
VNTNHESVAYRSFSPSKFEARGARKVTTGIDVVIQKLTRLVPGLGFLPRSSPAMTSIVLVIVKEVFCEENLL